MLPQVPRHVEEVHFVVSLPYFVRQAAGPRLDLVEPEFLLVVPRFAEVNGLVCSQTPWSTLGVAGDEHDKAAIFNLLDAVVSILASFDHLILVKVLIEAMHRLFWSVVPARVHPSLTGSI